MGITKFGIKILGTHVIISIVQLALMPALFGIWKNPIYQWFVGIFYIAVFWFIIYADVSYTSQKDLKRKSYNRLKGFLGGLIASIPSFILYILAMMFVSKSPNYFAVALRLWLIPYVKIFTTFDHLMPMIAIFPIFLFPFVCGISYLDGPRRRKKILDAIDKSKSMRAEKSRVRK